MNLPLRQKHDRSMVAYPMTGLFCFLFRLLLCRYSQTSRQKKRHANSVALNRKLNPPSGFLIYGIIIANANHNHNHLSVNTLKPVYDTNTVTAQLNL